MIISHFHKNLEKNYNFTLTKSQNKLLKLLAEFTFCAEEKKVLLVKGYAGTGKTTMLSGYVRLLSEIKMKYVLLAPTGRAAKVLSAKSGAPASTIHRKIYRQKSSKDGFGKFILDKNLHTRTVFIVDEASMISNETNRDAVFGSGNLLNDLVDYVYNEKSCSLILVGDPAQLPPVGSLYSPALQRSTMDLHGLHVRDIWLIDVVRQQLQSGILNNATHLRLCLAKKELQPPFVTTKEFADVVMIKGNEVVELIQQSYDKVGEEETLVVTRSNKQANMYNQGIRNTILLRDDELTPGDLLMVVKNNYFWIESKNKDSFIANGDSVELLRVKKLYEMFDFRFADCTIRTLEHEKEIEAKILLDVIYSETPALDAEKSKSFFYQVLEDYQHLSPRKKQFEAVKEDKFFNALQVKFAYAVTCHKAQGGQWKHIYIDLGYITEEMIDAEFIRWLYTAITRATDKIYLVNFPNYLLKK